MRVPSPKKISISLLFVLFQAFSGFFERSTLVLSDRPKSRLYWYHTWQHKNRSYALLSVGLIMGLWGLTGNSVPAAIAANPANPLSKTTSKPTSKPTAKPALKPANATVPKASGLPVRALQQPASTDTVQIVINGQTHKLPWVQLTTDRGQRLGLPDGVLKKLFNLEFLSTDDATRQPF